MLVSWGGSLGRARFRHALGPCKSQDSHLQSKFQSAPFHIAEIHWNRQVAMIRPPIIRRCRTPEPAPLPRPERLAATPVRPLVAAPVPGARTARHARRRWCRCCCSWRRSFPAFWYLRNEDWSASESVKRDTEMVQQQIRLRLIENQEQLVRMARDRPRHRPRRLPRPGRLVQRERPRSSALDWIGANRARRWIWATAMPGRDRRRRPAIRVSAELRQRSGMGLHRASCASRSIRALPMRTAAAVFQVQVPLIGPRPSPARWWPRILGRGCCATSCRRRCRTAT